MMKIFEEEDPREALVAQLLEYRKFKYAATVLQKEEERKLYYTKNQWIWMIIKRKIQHYRLIKSIQLIYF